MGFGILFIGYFLLLNVVYPAFTNIIAALIMLLGLSKLQVFNKGFKLAYRFCIGFAAFSAFDLIYEVLIMLMPQWNLDDYASYLSMIRYLIICICTYTMLMGIEEITKEVKLTKLPKRSRSLATAAIVIYGAAILFEAPFMSALFPPKITGIILALIILALFVYIIPNLYLIYTCFARIGMPGEEHTKKEKKNSRFEFVNEMRAKKEERARENAEYKLLKMQKKQKRKAEKNNGKGT